MSSVSIQQTPLFSKKAKKLKKQEKAVLDDEIRKLLKKPKLGQIKKGDLAGMRVHKYKFNTNLMLLAYTFAGTFLTLINIDSHANFYKETKKYLNG